MKASMKRTRREFTMRSAALAAVLLARRGAVANPLGLPLGLQLYSVREQMAQDLEGTLAAVAEAGYTEVEAAALPKKTAKEIRAALDRAGLRCVSAHHPFGDLHPRFEELVAYDKELGVEYVICSSPGRRPAPAGASLPAGMTLDDWHYCAEQFDAMGEAASRAGVGFGYHNHTGEFTVSEGRIPLLELLRLTRPDKVTFEMDCGWVVVGGGNPVDLLREHPGRFSMLHVKDFNFTKTDKTPRGAEVTELGRGIVEYRPIFAQAAKTQHLKHAFVEQEAFDIPWKESLRVDAAYMRRLS
jgi:sugar phosphate isomerase/epimerase